MSNKKSFGSRVECFDGLSGRAGLTVKFGGGVVVRQRGQILLKSLVVNLQSPMCALQVWFLVRIAVLRNCMNCLE